MLYVVYQHVHFHHLGSEYEIVGLKMINTDEMIESVYNTTRNGDAAFLPIAQVQSEGMIITFQIYGFKPGSLDIHVSPVLTIAYFSFLPYYTLYILFLDLQTSL